MTGRVPFVALSRQHGPLMEELRGAFDRVVGASSFILGEEAESFEREFAAYCGVRHCIGTSSGTAALTLALIAAGIGEGDEVIVPSHTFVATGMSVLHAGAAPILCDVQDATGLIDIESAEALVTERTVAVVPVHLYGQAVDMDSIDRFAERYGLAVFEDAAQAHGAEHKGRRVGSLGAAAAFSFYPSKNLGALGDGGAICTNDAELAERARMLRDHGQRSKGEHLLPGFNERLDGVQAAMLRVKLPHLDRWNEARRAHADAYHKALGSSLRMLETPDGRSCVHHVLPVRTPDRKGLQARLTRSGIETGIHYPTALHQQPFLRDRAQRGADLPAATAWAAEELSLPMFPELSESEIDRVIQSCAS